MTSHSTPRSPLGRGHLNPGPAVPAPEQPRGFLDTVMWGAPSSSPPDTFFLYNEASQPYTA